MKRSTPATALLLLLFVVFTFLQSSTASPPCRNLTASLTVADMTHFFFSGNHYNNINLLQALRAFMHGARQAQGSLVKSVNDWEGIDADVQIEAGYLEPGSDHVIRLFGNNGDVYNVDFRQGRSLQKSSLASMFTPEERKYLSKGIQAATAISNKRLFFSGCNVLQTDFKGHTKKYDLRDTGLPCDVDSVMPFPRKNSKHLVVTKGARAYGLFLRKRRSRGYDMLCAKDKIRGTGLNLCGC